MENFSTNKLGILRVFFLVLLLAGLTATAAIAQTDGTGFTIGGPRLGTTIPFILDGGWIVVDVSIDGHGPFPFIFDTGARTVITPEVAKAVGGTPAGGIAIEGEGPHLVPASTLRAAKIAMGGTELGNQDIFVSDLPNMIVDRGSRPRAAGLLGSEILSRYAVRIDYRAKTLKLVPLDSFEPPAESIAVPLDIVIDRNGLALATFSAEIDGIAAQFTLDTGNSGQIRLNPEFEYSHRLLDKCAKLLELDQPALGGRVRIQTGIAGHLKLAGVDLMAPVVSRPANFGHRQSWRGRVTGDGLLGGSVLSHFIVTINYKNQHAYFESLGRPQLSRGAFGIGISFDKPNHESFEVVDVEPGSPADKAKLRPGDRIMKVNGNSASDFSIGDFRDLSSPQLKSMVLDTADGRHFDIPIVQLLP